MTFRADPFLFLPLYFPLTMHYNSLGQTGLFVSQL